MRKFLFLFLLSLFASISYAQSQPYIIKHCEGTSDYVGDSPLICSNEARSRWFAIIPEYIYEKNELSPNGFTILKMDIGKCSREDWLIFTFDDGSRVTLRSTNKELDCGYQVSFRSSTIDNQSFALRTIKCIRYINGNDLKSFTYHLTEDESKFLIKAYNNFIVVKAYCNSR